MIIVKRLPVYLIACSLILTSNCFAQSARSLFSNNSGVSFDAKLNEAHAKRRAVADADQSKQYSGLSYSLLQQFPGGELRKVSPDKGFKTGDQIKIVLTSNKSGELSVVNIDPAGKSSLLLEKAVVAGTEVSIPEKGLLRFVGASGTEQLIFVLAAKSLSKKASELGNPMTTIISSCFQNRANTRGLALDDSAGNQVAIVDNQGKCATSSSSTTRSLVVEVVDNSGYAVMPDAALADGQMLTLKINLRHQ